jgi:hypothetical protein
MPREDGSRRNREVLSAALATILKRSTWATGCVNLYAAAMGTEGLAVIIGPAEPGKGFLHVAVGHQAHVSDGDRHLVRVE